MYIRSLLPLFLLLIPLLTQAQTAKIQVSDKNPTAHSIITIDLSLCVGDEVIFTSVPDIKDTVPDTNGKIIYAVPHEEGPYILIVTVTKGKVWSQDSLTLTVGQITNDLIQASYNNIPKDAKGQEAMAKWHRNFADTIIKDNLRNKEIFEQLTEASTSPPWSETWTIHYDSLKSLLEKAAYVLPAQWAQAHRDIAEGLSDGN